MKKIIYHPFPSLYDADSKILILGSFPSVKSREQQFFYGHPQNRFWTVTSTVFKCETPKTVEEKKAFLHSNHIALWDVIASCEIEGSSDSSITNVVPNDLRPIIDGSHIERIFVNGRAAERFYNLYTRDALGRDAIYLPSTSPANAAWSIEKLVAEWSVIADQISNMIANKQ